MCLPWVHQGREGGKHVCLALRIKDQRECGEQRSSRSCLSEGGLKFQKIIGCHSRPGSVRLASLRSAPLPVFVFRIINRITGRDYGR